MEEKIMQRTFLYLDIAPLFFVLPLVATSYYTFKWLGLSAFYTPAALLFAMISNRYPQYVPNLYERYRRFLSLYAARDEAEKCLDLLRKETSKGPVKANYSCVYGSCTATLKFSHMEHTNRDIVNRNIDSLVEQVACNFLGAARISHGCSHGDYEHTQYASLICTRSWGGIAHWIAKRQLGESINNSTEAEITPSNTLLSDFDTAPLPTYSKE